MGLMLLCNLLSEFRKFLESCRSFTMTADSDVRDIKVRASYVRDPAILVFLCPFKTVQCLM
jgi:hypothetical protein